MKRRDIMRKAEAERKKSGKSSMAGNVTGWSAEDATDRHIRRHPKQYAESTELYEGAIDLV